MLDKCNRKKDDEEKTKILAEFLEEVLRHSPNDLHHCVKLSLSGSYRAETQRVFADTIVSVSKQTVRFEINNAQKTNFVGWVERAKQVKNTKFTFGKPPQRHTVEEVVRCLDEMDAVPRRSNVSVGVDNTKANLASAILMRCSKVEAGALMNSMGGNKTPFNRKFIFHSLAEAYTNINGIGFRGKRRAKFHEWVYTNIVVSFEADKDIYRTVETLISKCKLY